MALRDIIKKIQKLNTIDQLRLKDFLIKSLASNSEIEPIFKEISEQKHKAVYTGTPCHSTNAVRFGKYPIKAGVKVIDSKRYRCKDCGKTFTDVINIQLKGSHPPHKWLDCFWQLIDVCFGSMFINPFES